VARNDGRVYADEIHAPLVYPGGTHIPYASVSEQAANHSVTGTAASKGWNLPGLKCAQLILTNDADAATWAGCGFTFEHGASILGVRASIAAYREGGDWLADVVRYLDGSRELLAGLLAEHLPEIRYQPPEGTYLAWLDCRDLVRDRHLEVTPAEFFRARARVLLTDGAACGEAGRDHIRLNFATPRPILTEIIRRMAAAVNGALAHPAPGPQPMDLAPSSDSRMMSACPECCARRGAPPGLLAGQLAGGEPQEVPVPGQHREQVGPLGVHGCCGRGHILLLCSDRAHARGHTGKVRS
jgi:Aminotransferase class I and II